MNKMCKYALCKIIAGRKTSFHFQRAPNKENHLQFQQNFVNVLSWVFFQKKENLLVFSRSLSIKRKVDIKLSLSLELTFRSGFQIGEPNGDVRKNFATKNAIAAVPAHRRPAAAGVASAAAQVAEQLLPSVAAMGPAEQTAVWRPSAAVRQPRPSQRGEPMTAETAAMVQYSPIQLDIMERNWPLLGHQLRLGLHRQLCPRFRPHPRRPRPWRPPGSRFNLDSIPCILLYLNLLGAWRTHTGMLEFIFMVQVLLFQKQ